MRMPFIVLVAALSSGVLAAQQAPDRSRPPQPGPPAPLRLPSIQKQKLSNGLPVWIVDDHKVPVAQVNLVVFSGTANDPPGKYGVASFAAAMLEEGAGSRSALEIADAVDFLGADVGATSTSDASAVRLHVPVARLADALPIMGDVALRPTFPRDELDRQRQQRLTSLLQGRDDPPTIAAVAFSRVLYGKAHRYGTAQMGTAETIKTFTSDDLRAFYASAFRPDNATLLAVGDFNAATLVPLLEKTFGSWKPAGAAVTESPCDIHTELCSGSPARTREPGSVTCNGVRPNSAAQTTSVSSSMPRFFKSRSSKTIEPRRSLAPAPVF